ncbi:MAG: glycosyltransferase family 4 protein [Planctomycetales bacterium]|nr:glycosyltransferase family 4 protein [Planctomycetales bacterium]
MKIAYLAAGAAGMYCGSCLHDNTLAAALLELGEDVVLAPIYTPIRTDEPDVSQPHVFYGGINAYLQQHFRIFRHTPRWLDRWFDHPALFRFIEGRGASVDPAKLGGMTVSMLQGEEGNQRKELERLVDWLLKEIRPEVVHLSNTMMLGLARMIAQRCGPPVVCSLAGEDVFLEKLLPPYYEQARELLRERASDVDAFVALNRYFADFMADYLAVDSGRMHVIPHGLRLEGHGRRAEETPARVGFVARICEDKGLHQLVEACESLAQRPELPKVELHAAGYLGTGDRKYLQSVIARVAQGPLAGRFTYHGELNRAEKIRFLQSLTVFSTPTVYRESKGLPALEALANAVPVVVPAHGAFPELLKDTGGGLLCEPHNAADLAEKIAELLLDPVRARQLGDKGQQAIQDRYHAAEMALRTKTLYGQLRRG